MPEEFFSCSFVVLEYGGNFKYLMYENKNVINASFVVFFLYATY
jgi:hypothetical protein